MRYLLITALMLITAITFGRSFLVPTNPAYSALGVKNHRVSVTVNNGAAKTKIYQVFTNPYNRDLEGTFIFPLQDGASVSKFRMKMGGKWVEGGVMEKNKARNIYQTIVNRMKDPGLIEYIDGNLFQARVYPIPKKGEMEIEITYTQVLPLTGNLYSYIYPLKKSTHLSGTTEEDFTFSAKIHSAQTIMSVYSPSHKMDLIKRTNKATAGFETKSGKLNEDVKLFYTVSQKELDASILTYKIDGEKKGYFMVMMAPSPKGKEVEVAKKTVLLVVDTSGSMSGDKMKYAKKALKYVVGRFGKNDRFNIIRFSTGVDYFKEKPVAATEDNVKAALKYVDDLYASGGTAIDEALQEALKQSENDRNNMVIFLTDGRPTVGETETKEILKNTAKSNQNRTKMFVFGIGDELNAVLLDQLAKDNYGEKDYMKAGAEIETVVSAFYDKVAFPVLINTKLKIEGMKVFDRYPYKMRDLFKGQQLYLFGRYEAEKGKDALLTLTGERNGKTEKHVFELKIKPVESNDFIPHIWATKKVGYLLEEIRLNGAKNELVEEVKKLAVKFAIVTPYTSYLVTEPNEPLMRNERVLNHHRRKSFNFASPTVAGSTGALQGEAEADDIGDGVMKLDQSEGYAGVKISKKLNEMQKGSVVKQKRGQKRAGGKTFIYSGNQWKESGMKITAKKVTIQFMSATYIKLFKNKKLKKYLTVGKNMVFVYHGYTITISETTTEVVPAEFLKNITK